MYPPDYRDAVETGPVNSLCLCRWRYHMQRPNVTHVLSVIQVVRPLHDVLRKIVEQIVLADIVSELPAVVTKSVIKNQRQLEI